MAVGDPFARAQRKRGFTATDFGALAPGGKQPRRAGLGMFFCFACRDRTSDSEVGQLARLVSLRPATPLLHFE